MGTENSQEMRVTETNLPEWRRRFYECDHLDVLGDLAMNGADPLYLEKLLLMLLQFQASEMRPQGSSAGTACENPSTRAQSAPQPDEPAALPAAAGCSSGKCDTEAYVLTLMHEYLIHAYSGTADVWERIASLVAAACGAARCENFYGDTANVKARILQFHRTCAREMAAIDEAVEAQLAQGNENRGMDSEAVMGYFLTRCFSRDHRERYRKAC